MENERKVTELKNRIDQARRAYFNAEGEVTLTDDEYDSLIEELATLEPKDPVLSSVGMTSVNSIWPKRKHEIPMTSLIKVKEGNGLREWWEKTEKDSRV